MDARTNVDVSRYKQTTGVLRRGDSYCYLGVLCDQSELGTWVFHREYQSIWDGSFLGRWVYKMPDGSIGDMTLPPDVAALYGLDFSMGGTPATLLLSKLNDRGKTLQECEDFRLKLIEQHAETGS